MTPEVFKGTSPNPLGLTIQRVLSRMLRPRVFSVVLPYPYDMKVLMGFLRRFVAAAEVGPYKSRITFQVAPRRVQ